MIKPRDDGWRTKPAYTIAQAAKLAKTSPQNARRWLFGYQAPGHQMQPVFGRKEKREPRVSFLELVELAVVAAFRKRNIKLDRLRAAHAYARERFGHEYPFASLNLKTDGAHVIHDFDEQNPGTRIIALDREGHPMLPGLVAELLEEFEFEDDLVARWYPVGKDVPIVVDPRYGAGKPTIVRRGVTVETLHKKWTSGLSFEFLARDYELSPDIVEAALQHAEQLAA